MHDYFKSFLVLILDSNKLSKIDLTSSLNLKIEMLECHL